MNINGFFIVVLIGLTMIFTLFKPLNLKTQDFAETPSLDIKTFTLYEFDRVGITTLMHGESALRYDDRYVVEKIDYTDNAKKYRTTMLAENGIYKDNIVNLSGNIIYNREDGLVFKTQKADYDRIAKIVSSTTDYTAYMGKSSVKGSSLNYNAQEKKLESTRVQIVYQLKEEKL
ncbi:MAG: LPS export ABC transporter periplasmic protein LptC [Sulfurimonas sp.]|nr:LPS export ABC transporter periplasmic protein LptC [Sulfurimonas sp.]